METKKPKAKRKTLTQRVKALEEANVKHVGEHNELTHTLNSASQTLAGVENRVRLNTRAGAEMSDELDTTSTLANNNANRLDKQGRLASAANRKVNGLIAAVVVLAGAFVLNLYDTGSLPWQ